MLTIGPLLREGSYARGGDYHERFHIHEHEGSHEKSI